jgi:hypothetical protein
VTDPEVTQGHEREHDQRDSAADGRYRGQVEEDGENDRQRRAA